MVEQSPNKNEICATPNASPVEGDQGKAILSVAPTEDTLPTAAAVVSAKEPDAGELPNLAPAAGQPQTEAPQTVTNAEVCDVQNTAGKAATASELAQAITVTKPEAGLTKTYEIGDNSTYNLAFDMKAATVTMDGNDIIIKFQDGAVIILDEFADKAGSNTQLIVDNCEAMGAPDFMQVAGLNLADIAPAAGPQAGAAPQAAGPQGGANDGAGFSPFDPAGLPPGVNPTGPLGPTALNYGVPDPFRGAVDGATPVDNKPNGFSAEIPLNIVDETGGGGIDGLFSNPRVTGGNLTVDYGADGPGDIRITAGPTSLTHHGETITIVISADGHTATGISAGGDKIFEFVIDPTNGNYSFIEYGSLDHPIAGNPNEPLDLPFTIRVTDGDGDFVDGDVVMRVLDDAPFNAVGANGVVDETGGTDSVSGTISFNYGADGAGSVKLTGGPSDLTSGGQTVVVTVTDGVVTGKVGEATVFTLTLNPATGGWTFTQLLPLDHPDTADHNDALNLGFTVKVTDYDGDSINLPINIVVRDDGPTAGDVAVSDADFGGATVDGNLPITFGEDGPGTISLTTAPTGLTHDGNAIVVTLSATGAVGEANGVVIFTLTLDPNTGAYSFQQFQPIDGDPKFNIGYQVVDNDGDVATGNIVVTTHPDGYPEVGESENTMVDETGGFDTVTGALNSSFGADGAGDIKLTAGPTGLTSHGVAVTLVTSADGHTITGMAGGVAVFTVTLNTAAGTYTFTQLGALDHPNAANPDDAINLGFNFTTTDSNGDSANGRFTVTVKDDGPSISNAVGAVDETGGFDSIAGVVSFSHGQDGPGSLTLTNAPTGLTSHGVAVTVTLSADGTSAVGKAGDVTVFTLTLNPTTGAYTFTQNAALDHPNTGDHNDVLSLGFGVTVKDYDGDSATGSITIKVADDGPTACDSAVVVDETGGFDTVGGTVQFGFGADGAGTVTLTNAPTGLTSHGVAVTVTLSADGTSAMGKAGDVTVFTLTLNPTTGAYTFTQNAALDHPNASNPNDALNLGFGFKVTDGDGDSATGSINVKVLDDGPTACDATSVVDETGGFDTVNGSVQFGFGADGAGKLVLTGSPLGLTSHGVAVNVTVSADGKSAVGKAGDVTVFSLTINPTTGAYTFTQNAALDHPNTADHNDALNLGFGFKVVDGDGDSASGCITIVVRDDGPSASNVAVTDELGGGAATGTLPFSFGADGAGHVDLAGSPSGLTSNGQAIVVSLSGNSLVGKVGDNVVFTLQVDGNTGAYSYQQFAKIDGGAFTVPYTVKDGDGDTTKALITITPATDNGEPCVGTSDSVVVDETGGFDTASGNLHYTYGPDGAGGIVLTSGPTGLTSHGNAVNLTTSVDGKVITGMAGGVVVFTVTLNADGSGYTFVQKAALDHPDSSNPNDALNLNFGFKVTDVDGDSANGNFNVKVYDDGPTAGTSTVTVDETGGFDSVSGNLSFNFNMDGAGKVAIATTPTGLTSHGVAVTVTLSADGTTAVGKAGDVTVFTLTVNPTTGAYTFTQNAALDHPNTGDHNDALNLGFGFKVTDFDGDSVNGNLTVVVRDDGPTVCDVANVVDETGGFDTVSGTLVGSSFGADGAGKVVLNAVPTGLTSHGVAVTVTLSADGKTAVGKAGDVTVFSLTINPTTGAYTFTQNAALDHPNTADHNDALNLGFGFKMTDGDGDSGNGAIIIKVLDDGPTAANVALTDEIGGGAATGTLPYSFGADGAGHINLTTAPSGLTSNGSPIAVTLTDTGLVGKVGDTIVFTLTINPTTGAYSYQQNATIDGGNFNVGYKVTDDDGDTTNALITITPARVDGFPCVGTSDNVVVDETGGFDTATGNLNFSYGPDGAGSVSLTGGPTGLTSHGNAVTLTTSVDGKVITGMAGGVVVFTVTLNAETGKYTFVQKAALDHPNAADANDSIDLRFDFKVADSDGDTAAGFFKVKVYDDGPSAGTATVSVDETGGFDSVGGTLPFNFNMDGAGKVAITTTPTGLTSHGVAVTVTLSADGTTAVGKAGDVTVFTLTVNPATGAYSFTQSAVLDHPNTADHNDVLNLGFGFTVKDYDGDTATGSLNVKVYDDGPTAANSYVTVDETGGFDTVNGVLSYSYGADGAGKVELTTQPTGLTSHGVPVTVTASADGTVLTGKAGDVTVFTLTLNPATGAYTFSQKGVLDHANGNDANDSLTLGFGFKVTDGDGDSVTTGCLIVTVKDDGPTVCDAVSVVDETGGFDTVNGSVQFDYGADGAGKLVLNAVPTGLTSHGAAVTVTLSADGKTATGVANGAAVFTLTLNPATGGYTFTQLAALDHPNTADHNDVLNLGFGFKATDSDGDSANGIITIKVYDDGPTASNVALTDEVGGGAVTGTLPYSYGLDGAGHVNVTSAPSTLFSNGAVVNVTQTDTGVVGKVGDNVIFSLTVNPTTGAYTYQQFGAIDGGNFNVGYKVTDGDGDTTYANITITPSKVDGFPCVNGADNVVVDETGGFDTANGNLHYTYGPDGAGSVVLTGGPTGLTSHGNAVTLTTSVDGKVITGMAAGAVVFTVTLNADGSGYTFVQKAALDHPDSSNPNDFLNLGFGFKVTDSDGDAATGNFNVKVYDDGPTAGTSSVSVDETGGFDSVSGNLSFSFNMDGAGKVAIATTPTGLTSHGVPVTVVVTSDGLNATGIANGVNVFTLTVNPTTGAYTFTQLAALDHPNAANHNDVLNLGFGIKVTDFDGDSVTGNINVAVYDDGPSLNTGVGVTIDETAACDTVGDRCDGVWAQPGQGTALVANGTVTGNFGADGAGSLTLLQGPSGLTHHGQAITVAVAGNVATGKLADGTIVFTLSVNAGTGEYAFKQYASLDHANTADHNDKLALNFKVSATDFDGDTAVGNLTVSVLDDGPTGGHTAVVVNQSVWDDWNPNTAILCVTGNSGMSYGNDGEGHISLTEKPTNIFSYGQVVTVSQQGECFVGTNECGQTVFTLNMSCNGTYTYTQYLQVDNCGCGSESKSLAFGYTVVDADGDSSTGNISVSVQGDVQYFEPYEDVKEGSLFTTTSLSLSSVSGVEQPISRSSWSDSDDDSLPGVTQPVLHGVENGLVITGMGEGPVLDVSQVLAGHTGDIEDLSRFVHVSDDGQGNTLLQVDSTGTGTNFTTVATLQGVTGVSLETMVADGAVETGRFLHG